MLELKACNGERLYETVRILSIFTCRESRVLQFFGFYNTTFSAHPPFVTNTVPDLHSKILDARPLSRSNFLQFHAVFGKILLNNSLAPQEILDPPRRYRYIFVALEFRKGEESEHSYYIQLCFIKIQVTNTTEWY